MTLKNKLSHIAKAAEKRDLRVMELLEKHELGTLSFQDEQELNQYTAQSPDIRSVVAQHKNNTAPPSWDSLINGRLPGADVPEEHRRETSSPSPMQKLLDWLKTSWPQPVFGLAAACLLCVVGYPMMKKTLQDDPNNHGGTPTVMASDSHWEMELRGGDLQERSAVTNGPAGQKLGVVTPESIVTIILRPQTEVKHPPKIHAYLTKEHQVVAALSQPTPGARYLKFTPNELTPPVGPGKYEMVVLISDVPSAMLDKPEAKAVGAEPYPAGWQRLSNEITIQPTPDVQNE